MTPTLNTEVKPLVKYVDAICGSGKSYNLKQDIEQGDKVFKRYLLVMPTIELCSQFSEDLKILKVKSVSIQADRTSATLQLKQAMAADYFPRHIVCTHEAFKQYCYRAFHDQEMRDLLKGFNVFVDEIPTATFGAYIKVDSTQDVNDNYPFLDWLEERDGLHYVKEDHKEDLLSYWQEKNANSKDLKQLLWVLLTGSGMLLDEEKHFFAYTATPITFAALWASEFVVMGAGVSRSEYAHFAEIALGADVVSADQSLYPDYRRRVYPNNNVTIYAVMEESASLDKLAYVFTNHLSELAQIVGSQFIYASNNDKHTAHLQCDFQSIAMEQLGDRFGGDVVSMSSYGLNHFQHYSRAVFLGVSNDNRDVNGKWNQYADLMGWDWSVISEKRKAARNYEQAYQFVSRCSIRNFDSRQQQVYIVPDEATALYLKQHYFENASVDCLGFDKPKAERKARDTSKGEQTRLQIQQLKSKGLKQKDVVAMLGLSKGTVSGYWK